jgi:hypothetical protein
MTDYYDYMQNTAIDNVQQASRETLRELERQTGDMELRVVALEQKLTYMTLINEAMFSLLGEQLQLGEAELLVRIGEVAQTRKARADTKASCSSCERESLSTRQRCMYCGGKLTSEVPASLFVF